MLLLMRRAEGKLPFPQHSLHPRANSFIPNLSIPSSANPTPSNAHFIQYQLRPVPLHPMPILSNGQFIQQPVRPHPLIQFHFFGIIKLTDHDCSNFCLILKFLYERIQTFFPFHRETQFLVQITNDPVVSLSNANFPVLESFYLLKTSDPL